MKFTDIYQANLSSVKSGLTSLWCSEASSDKQKEYAKQLKGLINHEIFSSEKYEPLVQSMELYESSSDEEATHIFNIIDEALWKKCLPPNKYYTPYKHQIEAWKSLSAPDCRSMVVTTGTGSGKTECFMIPLVNELLQSTDNTHSVKAIFLYPLNALMEDQKERLQKLLDDNGNRQLTFVVYNGNLPDRKDGTNNEEIDREEKKYGNIVATRDELHRFGADIILTNPTMLEYMLIRDKDQHLFSTNSLRWVVVDEAHTFTGAAAAELAMLLRRVIHAFGTNKDLLHFAASSATIGNEQDKTKQELSLRKFIADISGINENKVDIIKGKRNEFIPTDDSEFSQCKKKLTDTCCDYIRLSELLPDYSSTEERLQKLDEFCENGLRAKVHYFYRVANSGIRVQLDNWEDESKGVLKLQSLMPLDPKATPALEIARCSHCGEYFAIGEINLSDQQHYQAATDSDNDVFDFSSDASNKVFFGVVPTKDTRKPNNQYVSIKGNEYRAGNKSSGDWTIVVNTNNQCPHCSADLYPKKKGSNSSSVNQQTDEDETKFKATRLRISSEFVSRLMAPGLLNCMKEKEPVQGVVDAPHKGQQYISFVDSRQAAAKGTFNQNVEVEKIWVFSRVYHKLLEISSNRNITKQIMRLEKEIEDAISNEDTDTIGKKTIKLNQLKKKVDPNQSKDFLDWSDIYNLLSDEDAKNCDYLCSQFVNKTNGKEVDEQTNEINSVCRERYIFAVMLSNLAKYPPFQANAETMGLFESYYPKLESIKELPTEIINFNKKFQTNIDLTEWKNLLKIYIDRTPRSNESIYLKMDNHLQSDIFNCSERFGLQRPPHRTARKPYLNDKCNNASLIPYLLAKVISPDSNNLLDVIKENRDDINKIVNAMWKDLIDSNLLQFSECIKNKATRNKCDGSIVGRDWIFDKDSDEDKKTVPTEQQNLDGKQLRLNVTDIAFRLPEHVYFCEIPEKGCQNTHIRPTYTTFCGYSPYMNIDPDSGKATNNPQKPKYEEDWTQQFEYTYGKKANGDNATPEEIVDWLRTNRQKMYEYGLMGEEGCFNTRVLSILSYPQPFIQAEHTAQVEKKLSRKTQELFKEQKLNILACSTTMEMGVDLGNLELVLLASIPPHPANYKQRAGRSGRNDSNRSACITLCSSDAVGHRVLRDPMRNIIQRPVSMPFVDLDCPTIIQRHINAFLYRHSGLFFSDKSRSSLNWRILDIFSNFKFGKTTKTINSRNYTFEDYWKVLDTNDLELFPTERQPLGDTSGTRFEKFSEWLKNDAAPSDISFLLKGTTLTGCEDKVIQKCLEEWVKRYQEIERELAFYGKLYDEAYQKQKEKDDNNPNQQRKALQTRELQTSWGTLLRAKYNSILKRRLIEFLATHRFTPNANMPVNVVEFDVYHNRRGLNPGKSLPSNPSYSLQQALSQYAPGNMVVKENRIVCVAGVEYYGKDTAHDRSVFKTDGVDVVGVGSKRRIDPRNEQPWSVNNKKELELICVKSFTPDINAQDSRVLRPSPYTNVCAYLVGAEEWSSSGHHLMSTRSNLDAGEAQVLYYNDGLGYGYCMCPNCGKMSIESHPVGSGLRFIPSDMTSMDTLNGFGCHYAIDRLDDNGKPKKCVPLQNKYYRNVIIGGLIQTDFCEMIVKKPDFSYASKTNDKTLLTTLGLVISRVFTEYIGKDRNSVDFIVMNNGHLCIFDTNPGGSGYSNKLSDNIIRREVMARSKEMLETIKDKEELLDKFTVRYLNDVEIDITKEWIEKELYSWDNTPDNVKGSKYSSAKWSSIIDILKDFENVSKDGKSGALFCNDNYEQWIYNSSDPDEVRKSWANRLHEILEAYATGNQKVDLVISTDKALPNSIRSILPYNSWATIKTIGNQMDSGFYPLAIVNGNLYFTDEKETSSLNGEWAKGSVFRVEAKNFDYSPKSVCFENDATTCIFELNESDNLKCESKNMAKIVLDLATKKGLKVDDFFEKCKKSTETVEISYTDEHLKSIVGMIATMHFIDVLLDKMERKENFHIKFINEKYYTASSEVYQPWLNIEKWERRNELLKKLANNWIENQYKKTEDEAEKIWENISQNEKTLPHWRVLRIKCGNKQMNIYPHGGIINEWQVDRRSTPKRKYTMNDTTKESIPLVRTNPIMYIIEIVDK